MEKENESESGAQRLGGAEILQLQIFELVTFGGQTLTQGQSCLMRNGVKLILSHVVEKHF